MSIPLDSEKGFSQPTIVKFDLLDLRPSGEGRQLLLGLYMWIILKTGTSFMFLCVQIEQICSQVFSRDTV